MEIPYLAEIRDGAIVSVALFIVGMGIGTIIGVLVGLLRRSSKKWLSVPASIYSWFWRSLPTLVVLYFGFYGLPYLGLLPDAFTSAGLLIGLTSAAYVGEIIQGGLGAIPRGQWDAAGALGIGWWDTLRRIILPQVLRITIGPYISQCILIWKGTSLAGIVGVAELTAVTYSLIQKTYVVWDFLLVAAVIYLAGSSFFAGAQRVVERSARYRG